MIQIKAILWGPSLTPRLKNLYRNFSYYVSFPNMNWKEHDSIIKKIGTTAAAVRYIVSVIGKKHFA